TFRCAPGQPPPAQPPPAQPPPAQPPPAQPPPAQHPPAQHPPAQHPACPVRRSTHRTCPHVDARCAGLSRRAPLTPLRQEPPPAFATGPGATPTARVLPSTSASP